MICYNYSGIFSCTSGTPLFNNCGQLTSSHSSSLVSTLWVFRLATLSFLFTRWNNGSILGLVHLGHLGFDVFSVRLFSVVVSTIRIVHLNKLVDCLMGLSKLFSQVFHEVFVTFFDSHVCSISVFTSFGLLDFTNVVNIVDRVDNLTNFFRILILFIDLILKILLQFRIQTRNNLQLTLSTLHLPLQAIEHILKLIQIILLSDPSLFHININLSLSSHQSIVLSL